MLKKNLLTKSGIREAFAYIFWGGITTAMNWGVYTLLVRFFQIRPFAGNIASWVAAVSVAYITNKLFVFENKDFKGVFREVGLFLSARILSGILEIFGLPVLMAVLKLKPFFETEGFGEKLILSVIVVVLNYFFSKNIIFKVRQ